MADHDVPDSTDWLSTPLNALAAVEGALRCQVCKDFFKTPMITSCSHTFCSLCIRRALSNEGKCPLCRAPEQELKLRSNWSMEEAVQAFIKARPATLELARNKNTKKTASKRKTVEDHHESEDAPDGKRLRSSARLRSTRSAASSYTIPPEEDEIVEVPDSDDDFQPEPDDGLVACPVCQSRMKEWQVFKHLETCTGPTPKPRRTPASSSSSSFSQQRQQTKAPDRLPAINYSMYKEQALRKKMSDLGISNQGPRPLLERRHKEWMTIWNSNCDAVQPRKRSELLHDLDVWERTQGGRAPTTGRSVQNAAIIKDKDFDGAAWAAKHDTSFKDLIANARKTRLEAKKKAEEGAKESKAETPTTSPQEASNTDQPQPSRIPDEQPSIPPSTNLPEHQARTSNANGQESPNLANSTATAFPPTSSAVPMDIPVHKFQAQQSLQGTPPLSHPAASHESSMDLNNTQHTLIQEDFPQAQH
ncbi:E3 ubiquitin-protein ligase rad18 [Fusarium torreyae]|uniref:Postreplication repair E3 ubiquitin-protein ligase RAD18 n=1 Tax=Fusarium torreyae TaxID=1237075 RepID=A0A9W8RZA8_9HYPO|nr:E3 ubiquitin-protein ligase rad18 [Fusarium torreyae]